MKKISKKLRTFKEKILKQARLFLLRGFAVVPIAPRRKAPSVKNWTELRLNINDLEDAFGPHDNLGVILGDASGGLVDVDLDCEEAISVAATFLPPTNRIHGRDGKPRSHYWFKASPVPSPLRLTDINGATLAELRSNGQQTVAPPSIHPSGETFHWVIAGDPGIVDAETLRQAVRRVAACSLMARHWPVKGSRHDVTLALAGFLFRNGWTAEAIKTFVAAAASVSMRDEEWRSRQADVESTVTRIVKGLPATGIPRLAALIGDNVVSKLTEWLGIAAVPSGPQYDVKTATWPDPPASDAFHGLAGEVVALIEPHSESDPIALLAQFLVGFGNVIGRSAHILVEADNHFTNLFTVLVGATSKARKGSSLSHIKRILREADTNWADARVMSGLSSEEGLIWAVRDPTYSKDGDKVLDIGVDDKRLLAVESEFAQQLKLMARESNILSTVIRQAWDNGNLRTITKNSPAQATGAHISIIGHITSLELRRYLNETELGNGFGNRFLWLCVKRSKVLPEPGRIDDGDLSQITARLVSTIEWARSVEEVRLSAKARQLWKEVYSKLSEGTAGLTGAVTSRGESQVNRLALIYALLDQSPRIQSRHLKAALALWDYAQASARFIFGESLGDPVADEVLAALRSSPSGLTRTEISSLFGGHRKSGDIGRALVVLAQSGLASCKAEPTGGRPDEWWFVLTEGAKDAK